jgi:hypothetical protein
MKKTKEQAREQTFRGLFWQAANPDQQWFGKVRWKPSKSPRLTLHYKSKEAASAPPQSVEAFLGLDRYGKPLSVLRAGQRLETTAGFLCRKVYGAGHILRGVHVACLDEVRVNKVNVWFNYLGAWMGEEGLSDEHANDVSRIEYRRPEDRIYQISPNVTLRLCHSSTASSRSRKRTLTYDIFFSLEQERPFGFTRAFRWIDAFRSLLHFARLRRIRATKIAFENFGVRFAVGQKSYPKEIELYSAAIAEPIDKDPLFFDFVFTFNDLKDRFAEFCGSWLRFHVEQREAIGCYMTTVYANLTDQVRLICLTQALEAFHQRRFNSPPKSEEAYFINRVKALCERHRQQITSIVGDIGTFATSVRDSRHYYTHHDPSIRQKGNVLSGSKLTLLTYHLQYLFRLCVLAEFGLDGDPHSMLRRQIPGRITEFY